ncbi:hypothetical protein PAAG_01919 [Paracoccidioides lutzii Pb01]|uniref:Uncharacterized protein n=1 Tax=Paracoccidioides lutzii (strain ATCC MYA-826 / Pb01) TaxID=502779 RepID=C1GTS4_PARBA|nr:hypothetical protein PAAG_01919 [Paracoccidioides lutzii Pb01]EEH39730.2 hypothetical protein PAAG_01919 [Paracoccidioides lutzii Pb01]
MYIITNTLNWRVRFISAKLKIVVPVCRVDAAGNSEATIRFPSVNWASAGLSRSRVTICIYVREVKEEENLKRTQVVVLKKKEGGIDGGYFTRKFYGSLIEDDFGASLNMVQMMKRRKQG